MSKELDDVQNEAALLRAHLRLLMQITASAQESLDSDYFLVRCMEEICRTQEWSMGQIWFVNELDGIITCSASSYYANGNFADFRKDSLERRFTRGVGLPGRVWGSGVPICITEIDHEKGLAFPRLQIAREFGLNSAFAIPIANGPQIIGVMEFLAPTMKKLDAETERFFEKLGSFIGTYVAQKKAEHRALKADVRFSVVLDQAPLAFIGMNSVGEIVQWNVKAEEVFGWKRDEVVGRLLAEIIIPPEHREAHMKGLLRYMGSRKTTVMNQLIRTDALSKSGERVKIDMKIFVQSRGEHDVSFAAFISELDPPKVNPDIVL
jgi:PAS domain S-box-containing protein